MIGNNRYVGPERRRASRRTHVERRDAVRWEPAKDDRRHSYGRRAQDQTWRQSG